MRRTPWLVLGAVLLPALLPAEEAKAPTVVKLAHDGQVMSVAFSRSGKRLASAPGVRLWRMPGGDAETTIPEGGASGAVAFAPQAPLLAMGVDGGVQIVELMTGRAVRKLSAGEDAGRITSVAFSPDGQRVAAGGGSRIERSDLRGGPGTLWVWNIETGALEQTLEHEHGLEATSIAFSPDGSLLAAGSQGSSVALWDAHAWKLKQMLSFGKGSQAVAWSVAFSPDGRLLAAGGMRVRGGEKFETRPDAAVWRIQDGRAQPMDLASRVAPGHTGIICGVAFSPDGKLLATGSYDKTVALWSTATGELQARLVTAAKVQSLAWSPDGQTIAIGLTARAPSLWLWRVREGGGAAQ